MSDQLIEALNRIATALIKRYSKPQISENEL